MVTVFLCAAAVMIGLCHGQTTDPTQSPTKMPSNNPSVAPTTPTAAPVDVGSLEFESCVIGTQIVGGVGITMSRNTENSYMQLELSGPTGKWWAVGFGSTAMSGTYTIVSYSGTTTTEWTLGVHTQGSEISTNSWAEGTIEVQEADGIRTVTIVRPYSTDDSSVYDFSSFMSAASGTTLSSISAYGTEGDITFSMAHEMKASGRLTTQCSAAGTVPTPAPTVVGQPTTPGSAACMVRYCSAFIVAILAYVAL
eukprot:CAMPEP_0197026282 /NCGR_PEP_ID=MMETSP1384-20130603/6406_1 /TAXON_ID=29189 /ORGANISM="Ammonia sp." /LENGTH=251 /DNA_ID=CAMNT_0042454925 /DNA_START=36 /DNA_END=791 /DNA_ORIENTATION=-